MNDDQILERLRRNDPVAGMDVGSPADPEAREVLRQILAAEVRPARGPNLWARRRPGPAARRVVTTIAALVISLVGVGFALWAFRSTEPRVPAAPTAGLLSFAGHQLGDEDGDIYTVSPDGSQLTNLTNDPSNETDPAWSPDGARIAFARDEQGEKSLYVMDASGTNATRLGVGEQPSWSPTGERIVYVSGTTIHVIDADGSDAHPIVDDGPPGFSGSPAWSPDGTQIAFLRIPRDDDFGFAYLYVMGADGGNVRRLSDARILNVRGGIAWSPNGEEILFTGSDFELYAVRADDSSQRVLTDAASGGSGAVAGVSTDPAWSSDGASIAFIRNPAAGVDHEVFTMRADGTGVERVTDDDIEISGLSWQPGDESSR